MLFRSGFYRPGDAVRFAESADLAKGLVFDGRLAEDFKLTTGTWVYAGSLRVGVLAACSPVLQDAIIAGADRDYVGILAWLNVAGCQTLAKSASPPVAAHLAGHPAVLEHITRTIARWNIDQPATSTRIARVLLLTEPPSIDENEITDKGYINQRLVDRKSVV